MFQTGIAGQMLFLTVILFSLSILVINRGFNRDDPYLYALASLFFIPFSIFVFLFLYPPAVFSSTLFISANTLIALGILFILLLRDRMESFPIIQVLIYIIPLVLIAIFILFSNPYPRIINTYLLYANSLLLLIGFYLAIRLKMPLTFQGALLSMAVVQGVSMLPDTPTARILYVILNLVVFLNFFLFFYHEIIHQLSEKLRQAELKLMEWEKTVKHEVLKRTISFEHTHQALLDMSKIDGLTKSYTKTAIIEIIEDMINSSQQFTILMLDIDHFKKINDARGHREGDQVLVKLVSILKNSLRSVDNIGRYGGDEFIITLPRASVKDAFYVSERIRSRIENSPILAATVSIGIASYPHDGTNAQELIEIADQSLYYSKNSGRNKVSYKGFDPTYENPEKP